jgi:Tol biopolymer transport system component
MKFACGVPLSLVAACAAQVGEAEPVAPAKPFTIQAGKPVDPLPNEPHLANVRMLTFDGENAEAYWSNDGTKLIFQRRDRSMAADQIYVLDLATGEQRLVSTGNGRTTCSYFLQGDREIVYGSTHHTGDAPPVVKMTGRGYQWAVHQEYDLFAAKPDGTGLRQLSSTPGYDAEATVCPVTGTIVFTSVRDGDLELYTMEPDGSNVKRITSRPGYDGGAFFSHDGTKLVFRSAFPRDDAQAKEDAALLGQQIVRPSHMEITVCNRDGSGFRQLTRNGAANFAPYWLPDDKRLLFASNFRGVEQAAKTGDRAAARRFCIYLMHEDGSGLEAVTNSDEFDSFPMFSPDGKHLVWASNRYHQKEGETNLFVAEWID